MGYSNFKKIQQVTKKFGLSAKRKELFADIEPVYPSEWLKETLRKSSIAPLNNEKTKSERIVSPILLEIAEAYQDKITLFSGEALEIQPLEDLSGECDFFFTYTAQSPYLESPIISLTEAKDEDMEWGIAQCAAQLLGAKILNEQDGKSLPFLYGCATDGVEWQFIKFEGNVFYLHPEIVTDINLLLGIWHYVIKSYFV